jgi:NADH-quinone oxidoreductase subunit C
MNSEKNAQKLREAFPLAVLDETRFRDEVTLTVSASDLRDICLHARENLGFNYLIDVSSVDHFGQEPRYEVVYELYSMRDAAHLRLKITVSEDDCEAPTVSDIWPTADWHEREAYDMMGIRFKNHPDLRRILMWEGYPYHPLRKDFPLAGKHSDLPGIAFSDPAPLAGGPFVTVPTDGTTQVREPRARQAGELPEPVKFIAEP